jgi:flagellar biosynthesis/type III secretory pathway protein FliH
MRTAHLLSVLAIATIGLPASLSAQAPRSPQAVPRTQAPPRAQAPPRDDRDRNGRYDDRYDDRYNDRYRTNAPNFRYDPAFRTGLTDGYDAGYQDAQRRHRFDPYGEGRYKSGTRGYDKRYGSKDLWRSRYRDGFRRGYDDGFDAGRQYNRYDDRPWWRQ